MADFEISAELRAENGKGAARRMRRTGRIPAVIYGAGKDPVSLSLELREVARQTDNEAFFSHILNVKVDGKDTQAVVKDMQRDPATDRITHMDFLRVSAKQEITMNVPLHFLNEEECAGRKAGGVISKLVVDVEVVCLPKDLPESIEVDVLEMEIGQTLALSELTVPEGVTLTALAYEPVQDMGVVSVVHAQKAEEEEEAAEEGGVPAAEEAAPEDEEGEEPTE